MKESISGYDLVVESKARLPTELEWLIIELAADAHPETWDSLLRVCYRVHDWVEPFLFKEITITTKNIDNFLQYPFRSKRSAYFRQHVKTLCISKGVDPSICTRILNVCSNTIHVACWVEKPSCGQMAAAQTHHPFPIPSLVSPRLKRVSMCIQGGILPLYRGPAFDISVHAPFASLTHLEVLDTSLALVRNPFSGYYRLPNLTHLAMNSWATFDEAHRILLECKRLKVLLLLAGESMRARSTQDFLTIRGMLDRRLVVLPLRRVTTDWVGSINGEWDAWKEAEEIIEGRGTLQSW
ncbi:hypothetical protein B0H34DRAFT_685712 [Crassisporium funariophilum]|nr:hypothetical protein B0H34DRAFT_685712 [Crassisporium funariophilum]